MPSSVHHAARDGFQVAADTYARGRPDYPDALRGWLDKALALDATRTVLDLGAGTGKFTRLLRDTGARVIAVEPVAAMREALQHRLPGVSTLDGTAQTLPLEAESVDAVVCAQAFHWFADHAALREIHRVLRPDGMLGLIWNVRDESLDWVAAITRLISPYEGDAPRYHTGRWRTAFDQADFGPLEETVFEHAHIGTPEQVIVDRFLSVSFIAALPTAEQAEVARQLRALIAEHPALRGRQTLSFPYRTHAFRARRLPHPAR